MSADPAGTSRSWSRLDGVDALRGLAILLVLMNHVNMRLWGAHVHYTRGLPPQLVSSLVWNGQPGVQLFFAVSGFLISATSLRRWGSLGNVRVRQFYGLRFARIAPLLALLLLILSGLHLAGWRDFVVSAKQGGLPSALFAALTFHINLLEAQRGYLPVNWDILWSLSVEEAFYFAFPLTIRLLGRRRKLLVAVLIVFVVLGPFGRTVLTHGNEVWEEYSYLGGTDAIALGCLTALLLERVRLTRRQVTLCFVGGGLLCGFFLCFSITAYRWGLDRTGLGMTLLAVGACLLIAGFAETRGSAPAALQPLLRLGRHSYEVYLTHEFVVLGCFAVFERLGEPARAVWPMFAVAIVLAGLLGEFVARGYSEPMNTLLRRFLNGSAATAGAIKQEGAAA